MAQATQQIIWTCLPNGVDRERRALRLSVLVSPRLVRGDGPATIAPFDNMLDWPKTVAGADFRVSISGQEHAAKLVSKVDSEVWSALFPPATYLKSYEFDDFSDKLILSYPLAALERHIANAYQQFAVSARDELPAMSEFGPFARPLGGRKDDFHGVLKRLGTEGSAGFANSLEDSLHLLTTYHTPLEAFETLKYENQGPDDPQPDVAWSAPVLTALPKPEDFRKLIDFHQIVSSLNQYPRLLRRCGLVLDFEISIDFHEGDLAVSVLPKWHHAGAVETLPDELPTTACRFADGDFFARPRPGDDDLIVGRWLRIQGKLLSLVQMEVDGAGLKVKNFANSVFTGGAELTHDEAWVKDDRQPHRTGAPSLRSGGLTLAQRRRDRAVSAMFKGATELQDQFTAHQPLTLYAGDLVRGYRPDIWAERTNRWQSLCRRDAAYTLVNTGAVLRSEDEEGTVRLGATAAADGSNPNVMKIHEGLFVWRGWSLCAPMPMKAIAPDDTVQDNDNAAPEGLPLEIDFDARPGSLPTLRFGQTYRMQARLVDLAGNAVPFSEAPEPPPQAVSEKTTYLRFEPIEAPALALIGTPAAAEEPADGESMARLAIRTFNATPDQNLVATADVTRRRLFAPRVTHNFAELHGALDKADGRPDPELWSLLAAQDEPLREVKVETQPWQPPDGPSLAPVLTSYACAEDGAVLPWLPDPLAQAVAIRVFGLQHVDPEQIFVVDFYPDGARWPHAAPFVVQVLEGDDLPRFDEATRTFTVPLAKAERARLRVSCIFRQSDLDLLAIWALIRDKGLPASEAERLRKQAERGQHWMMTPWRDIDLVHAVQKPLVTPMVRGFGGPLPNAFRSLGELEATIGFSSPIHAKSTGRLDLIGWWQQAGDAASGGPDSRRSEAKAQSWTISRLGHTDGRFAQRSAHHAFPDTRYRRVFYRLEAATRFREYMPPALREAPEGEPLKVVSSDQRLWIPNSAPPPPPAIVNVIPTFGWSRTEPAGGGTRSWRRGGGLRVYLDRPWFVSGHGEMLGVLIPREDATIADIEGPLKPFVTQWGADPAWLGGRVEKPSPRPGSFPLRRMGPPVVYDGAPAIFQEEGADLPASFTTTALPCPGSADTVRVDVVPHQVGYDAERKLWYCDIVVDPGDTYFPFIRLALARYHPVSATGAHLSTVALADFQQLTPDRYLMMNPGRNPNQRKFALYGRTGSRTLGNAESGRVTVELQQLAPDAEETLDWRTYVPPHGPQIIEWRDRIISLDEGQIALRAMPPPSKRVVRSAREMAAYEEARHLSEAGRFEELASRGELLQALLPPLMHEGELRLPADRGGRRFRLLVTERELHLTGERDERGSAPTAERIVYAEAIEL